MTDGLINEKAVEARKYIEVFRTHTLPGTNHVVLSSGREIHFDSMTDEEAIEIAKGLAAMEAVAAMSAIKKAGRNG